MLSPPGSVRTISRSNGSRWAKHYPRKFYRGRDRVRDIFDPHANALLVVAIPPYGIRCQHDVGYEVPVVVNIPGVVL